MNTNTNNPMTNYTYERSHLPNTVSWYRELVMADDEVVGEIRETTDSTSQTRIYNVCRYEMLKLKDGDHVYVSNAIQTFDNVAGCKDFINGGGLLRTDET